MGNKAGNPRIIEVTTDARRAARARGAALQQAPTALVRAEFDAKTDLFTFELQSGFRLQVPRSAIAVDTIANADPRTLRKIDIDEMRTHVWFPDIDEGMNPVGMFARDADVVIQIERGRAGGMKKSLAKAISSAKNGKKGGRPRKTLACAAPASGDCSSRLQIGAHATSKGNVMKNKQIYVERTPHGDYAVRQGGAQRASAILPTQFQAIDRAREMHPGAAIHVERVRDTSGGSHDKWRKP